MERGEKVKLSELPNESLRQRVAGTPDAEWFRKSGKMSVKNIETILNIIDTSFTDYPRALDFGCGCGRILVHMKDIGEKVELYGVDIDTEAISWAEKHIPWVKFSVNNPLPPLDYPDGYFDLIFNHSVFSHIDETYQDAWLAELSRITAPKGVVILTIHGDYVFSEHLKTQNNTTIITSLTEERKTKGILFINSDGWNGIFPDFYHTSFHAPWYIFDHWSKYFNIKAYVTRGALDYQDYVLMYKK